jgi:co-chaperonin GroES (HSP10)
MRTIHYSQIFCIERDGEIIMMPKFNFLEPVFEDESNWKTPGGLLLKAKLDAVARKGKAKYINEEMRELGVSEGDVLSLRKNSEYEIDIMGARYYRVHNDDILAVLC